MHSSPPPAPEVTLVSLPTGRLSQFFASFPRASPLSASIGPPGPCTTSCLSTVSIHSSFVQTQGHSPGWKQTCPQEAYRAGREQQEGWHQCWGLRAQPSTLQHLWGAQQKGWPLPQSRPGSEMAHPEFPDSFLHASCFHMSE